MNTVSSQINNWLEASEIRNGIVQILNKYSARHKKTYRQYHERENNDKVKFTSLLKLSWYNTALSIKQKMAISALFLEIKNNETKNKNDREIISAERKKILITLLNKHYFDQLPSFYKTKDNKALIALYNSHQLIRDKQKSYEEIKKRKEQFIGEELLREYLESTDSINYMRNKNRSWWIQHISKPIQEFLQKTHTNQWVQLQILFDATSEQHWIQSEN